MTSPVDIRPDHLETVQGILREHLPVGVKVWVFGSRTNWTTKDSSDLDLALEGENKLSHKLLGALKDAFEESNLPYTVDVVDLNAVSRDFKQIVKKQGVPLPSMQAMGSVDGKWREVALGDVAQVRSGYAFKSADWTSIGIPVVKIANVKGGNLAMAGCAYVSPTVASQAGRFNLQEGDILIALTGYIGDVALVRNRDLPAVLNQRVGLFVVLDESRLENSFLFQLLRNPDIRESIEGLGYGSAQPNVSPNPPKR